MATKKATFHGHKNTVRHPETRKPLDDGESFDAPDLWLRQHAVYVNCGAVSVDEAKPAPKKRATRKKAAK